MTKISEATPDASVGGGELLPVSDAGSPKSASIDQIKDYVVDQIEAIPAGVAVDGNDKIFILDNTDSELKPADIDLVAQHAIDTIWGKAAEASPDNADVMVLKDGGVTEKTVTLSVLAEYVRATIEAAILDVSDLGDGSGALADADYLLVTQGAVGKRIQVSDLSTHIWSALKGYVTALSAVSTPAGTDAFYVIQGGVEKKVLFSVLEAAFGDVFGPGSTTEDNVPQWDSATDTLKDGLGVQTAVRADGVATDTDLATEKAVRDLHAGALTNEWGVVTITGSESLTAAQSGSLVLLNTNSIAGLPAVSGNSGVFYRFLAQTVVTQAPRVDPNGSEVINLGGDDLSAGYYIEATGIGDSAVVFCDGSKWWVLQESVTEYGWQSE